MKSFFIIFSMIFLCYLAHLFAPIWWSFCIVVFIVSFGFSKSAWQAFYTGFVALFMLWFALCLVNTVSNDFILLTKMSSLLNVPHSSLLFLATSLIGALLSGFSSLTAYTLKNINTSI